MLQYVAQCHDCHKHRLRTEFNQIAKFRPRQLETTMFLVAQYSYDQNPRGTHDDLAWAIECPELFIARMSVDPLLHPPIQQQNESSVDNTVKTTTQTMETSVGTVELKVTQDVDSVDNQKVPANEPTSDSRPATPIPSEDEVKPFDNDFAILNSEVYDIVQQTVIHT